MMDGKAMADKHWNENDLIDRLYGLDPAEGLSEAHLGNCPECGQRWLALSERRRDVVSAELPESAVLDERLRAQRLAIWNRVERPGGRVLWGAVPAAAAALMVVIAVSFHPAAMRTQEARVTAAPVSDTQLFTEIATVVNEEGPRASDPIRGLFDEPQTPSAQ
jgi:hypothetical protein